ncbi:MAG: MscS mechanosensitive ion channel [Candidatus Magnetoglobus multicellularis str. Araruama]|uniref:MscS mechanosensitive ion channel n=1 Tax=Candidatus Magnetoglobus multicellularis str. Araruama TaxID=890399 RepID=A0A1V1P8W2_9BACT|nr:MAG: MscS mechanosensitive ion channel [Candidatus Magnetoglobus multicellularis str. Araruama]
MGNHLLSLSFRHHDHPMGQLIYDIDVIGMGYHANSSFVAEIKSEAMRGIGSGWLVDNITFNQDVVQKHSKGDPRFFGHGKSGVGFSQFNFGIHIKKDTFTLRNQFSIVTSKILLLTCAILLVLLSRATHFKAYIPDSVYNTLWIFQLLSALLLLLSAESYLLSYLGIHLSTSLFEKLVLIFDILWWIIPAILVTQSINRFIWEPLEKQTGRNVPNLIRRMIEFLIYLLTLFGIIAFVFHQALTGLLATSGVLAMILGLAVQINIANIFSGIAINIEQPFRIGDWVQIGDNEGQVIDINWRTTRLQTRSGNVVSIANGQVSESLIQNFHYPDDLYWEKIFVNVDPIHPPDQVEKVLTNAVVLITDVIKPLVSFKGVTDWAANYQVGYFVKDYSQKSIYQNVIWKSVWKHLNTYNIAPVTNPYVPRKPQHDITSEMTPIAMLNKLSLFNAFSDEMKFELSQYVRTYQIPAQSTLIKQGEPGDSLFIIVEGVVAIHITDDKGEEIEVARKRAGDIIGEMALLTGEVRSATVISLTESHLFEIKKNDISPFLEKDPDLLDRLSQMLAERKMANENVRASRLNIEKQQKNVKNKYLAQIQKFFALKHRRIDHDTDDLETDYS